MRAVPHAEPGGQTLAAFREFALRARALVPQTEHTAAAFCEFIERATPVVVSELRATLGAHRAEIEALAASLVRHDLLEVAGYSGREVAYTELVCWLLAPQTHPQSALARQRVFLSLVARGDARVRPGRLVVPCDPTTNYAIADHGIADLVLFAPDFVVVVEAKTWTEEHEAPSGDLQTVAYERGMRAALRIAPETPVAVVLLAPELRVAANPRAVPITFARFAGAFAGTLQALELDDDTRWATRCVLTHLVIHATPRGARHMRAGIAAAMRYYRATSDEERSSIARACFDVLSVLGTALEDR